MELKKKTTTRKACVLLLCGVICLFFCALCLYALLTGKKKVYMIVVS